MIQQFGISIGTLPYTLLGFEEVLLFQEYPTTILYEDNKGFPVVKEWVDCSDDSTTDRYYYYRTTRILLKRFLEGEIPYREMIDRNVDGYVIFEDKSHDDQRQYFLSVVKSMPNNYLPQADYFFDEADSLNLYTIRDHFGLDDLQLPEPGLADAKAISNNKKSETLLIHFKKGRGIGFGTANTEVLSKTLLKFDRFYKETALDFKLGTQRGEIQLGARKNAEYLPITTTEVYGSIAASYALLLRPTLPPQLNLFDDSDAQKISTQIFSLISNSESVENLRTEYPKHSDFALKAFKALIDEIYSLELTINFNWFSPLNNSEFNNSIDYIKANQISHNLENLSIESVDKFTVKGKFRSLNCDTGHFGFVSVGGEKYYGHMDDLIKEGSERINFIEVYEVTVSRTILKEAGNPAAKIKDVILAFTVEQ